MIQWLDLYIRYWWLWFHVAICYVNGFLNLTFSPTWCCSRTKVNIFWVTATNNGGYDARNLNCASFIELYISNNISSASNKAKNVWNLHSWNCYLHKNILLIIRVTFKDKILTICFLIYIYGVISIRWILN